MSAASIIAIIQLALAAAPKGIEIAGHLKDFITALFTKGLIKKEEQDLLHAYVDSCAALVAAGIVPKAWRVDPDPISPTP